MVDFTVKNQDLINFLTKSSAKGVISVSQTEKIQATFFNKFFLEAVEDRLDVKALDTQGGTMWAWHKLYGVEIEEEGKFAVTDAELLLSLLKFIPGSRKINFCFKEDEPLTIMTVDEGSFKGFELDEWVTMSPQEIKDYKNNVVAFMDAHWFDDEGRPVIGEDASNGTYSTIVKIDKQDFNSIVSQSVSLTRDQQILVIMDKDGNVTFKSGKENATIKAKDIFNNITENPIVFKQKFGNLQPIAPHLYEEIKIFMRKASDGKVKWWIKSKNKKIELNFITGAV